MRYNTHKRVISMEKTVTLNLQINPSTKRQVEEILQQLGIPMSTAIDMHLRQIALTDSIPFPLTLPKTSALINADLMTIEQLRAKLLINFEDMQKRRIQDATEVF